LTERYNKVAELRDFIDQEFGMQGVMYFGAREKLTMSAFQN
jgi:hypothetical protein